MNKKEYFHNIVAQGRSYSSIVKKDSMSLEGQLISADVVETYVPIMIQDTFAGAYEIYYDISSRKERLDGLMKLSYYSILIIPSFLLIAVIVLSAKANKAIIKHNTAEEELIQYHDNLENVIRDRTAELTEALDKVKMLSGFLPICASCKKIRDDKGYWKQIEEYIREHSEAEFSHGICPECKDSLYPSHGDRNK